MTKLRLKFLVLTVLALLSLGTVAHAATLTSGAANSAYAEASATPGTSVFDLALGLRENATDTIDESNSAVAYSTCDGCRAIAIAFQVVIVQGRPSTIVPENVAVAVNEGCSGCSSLALAHQFVVGKGRPARITKTGRRELLDVTEDLVRLERSYKRFTNAEIEARVDADAAKVRAILDTELVAVDGSGAKPDVEEHRQLDSGA
jgi:putative peptide zinc metalloprotease protein